MEDKHEEDVNGSAGGTVQTGASTDADGHSAGSQGNNNPAESGAKWLEQLSREVRERVEGPEGFPNISAYVASLLDRIDEKGADSQKGGDSAHEGDDGKGKPDEKAWDGVLKEISGKGELSDDAKSVLGAMKESGITPEQGLAVWKAFAEAGKKGMEDAEKAQKKELVDYISRTFGTEKDKVDAGTSLISRGFSAFAKAAPDAYLSADRKGLTRTPEFMEMARQLASMDSAPGAMGSAGGKGYSSPSDPFGLFKPYRR